MKDHGALINNMGEDKKNGLMGQNMLEISMKDLNRDLEKRNGAKIVRMVSTVHIRGSGIRIEFTDLDNIGGVMGEYILVSGILIKWKVLDYIS